MILTSDVLRFSCVTEVAHGVGFRAKRILNVLITDEFLTAGYLVSKH